MRDLELDTYHNLQGSQTPGWAFIDGYWLDTYHNLQGSQTERRGPIIFDKLDTYHNLQGSQTSNWFSPSLSI